MKNLKDYICEGTLADMENTLASGDMDVQRLSIDNWIKTYFTGKYIISKQPNSDGLFEVSSKGSIGIKRKGANELTTLTNGMFIWTDIRFDFMCNGMAKLETLVGGPKTVKRTYEVTLAPNLKNLEGAPTRSETFNCSGCGLETLKGGEVLKNCDYVILRNCKNLVSLEGCPDGETLYCEHCTSLKSLDGLKNTNFKTIYSGDCADLTSINGVPNTCKKLWVNDCVNLKALDGLSNNCKKVACNNCTSLTSVKGADNVKEIYLSGCTSLTSLDGLPKTLDRLTLTGSGVTPQEFESSDIQVNHLPETVFNIK